MNEKQMFLNDTNQQKCVSDWLTVLPLVFGFTLNNEQFWGIICIHYGWEKKIYLSHVYVYVEADLRLIIQ